MVSNDSRKNPMDSSLDELLEKIKHRYPEAYTLIPLSG